MGALLCPKCEKSTMEWITDMDDPNLLETGIMKCKGCGEEYVGIHGFNKAHDNKRIEEDKRILAAMKFADEACKECGWGIRSPAWYDLVWVRLEELKKDKK